MRNDDADFKAQFEALKEEDARAARPFDTSWEAARRSVKGGHGWMGVPAAAAAVTLVLAAAIAVSIRPASPAIDEISRWQSPTTSLLKTPGSELLRDMPRIGEPVIRMVKEERQ